MRDYDPVPRVKKVCTICGKIFNAKAHQKYGTATCATIAQKQQNDQAYRRIKDIYVPIKRDCSRCGKEFLPPTPFRRWCQECKRR